MISLLPTTADSAAVADPWHTVRGVPHPVRALVNGPGLIGGGGPDVSADGLFVADIGAAPVGYPGCVSDNCFAYFVTNTKTQVSTPVGVAWDGDNSLSVILARPVISDDGNVAAFYSAGSGANDRGIFVRDLRQTDAVRVDVDSSGAVANHGPGSEIAISADGNIVAFSSRATNLAPGGGTCTSFGQTLACSHVYEHNLTSGETKRVSLASEGQPANGDSSSPSLSADGRFVAFVSGAHNLRPPGPANDTCPGNQVGQTVACNDVFLHDNVSLMTTLVSTSSDGKPATGNSDNPSISANGQVIAFDSESLGLVQADTNGQRDVFVHTLADGRTERIDVTSEGAQTTDGNSDQASISADGNRVAFGSDATTLDPQGPATCGPSPVRCADVFVRERGTGKTYKVTVNANGEDANGRSDLPQISADGRHVVFSSAAPNLAPDVNGNTFLALRSGQMWGDVNCTGGVDGLDALAIFQKQAGIEVATPNDCPSINAGVQVSANVIWGDINCSGTVDAQDAIAILRHAAGLSPRDAQVGCPVIGVDVVASSPV